jgi:hypothetical protein
VPPLATDNGLAAAARLGRALPLAVVLALLALGGLGHDARREIEGELLSGHYHLTPAWLGRGLRGYLTNDDDISHFHAYARATLGEPYRPFYIRSRAQWQAKFARGVHEDPDLLPPVVPAAPLRPYRDFLVEYPPGAFAAFLPPALVSSTIDGYTRAFKLEMAAFLLVVAVLAARLAPALGLDAAARARLPAALAAAVLALGVVSTARFDALTATCLLAAVLAAARRRPALAGLALGVGIVIKGAPLLLLPVLAAYLLFRQTPRPRAALGLLAVAGAVAGGALAGVAALCGPGLWDGFAYQRDRPIHLESTPGALLALANAVSPGLVSVVHSFGSRNLHGPLVDAAGAIVPFVSAAATASAMALVVWRLWRLRRADEARRLGAVVDGAVLVLAVPLATGKVFCPQYLMWLLPFALLASFAPGRSARWRWTGVALLAVTQVIYPIAYGAVKALAPWASTLVLARNLGLLAWAALLLRPHPAGLVTQPSPTRHPPVVAEPGGAAATWS